MKKVIMTIVMGLAFVATFMLGYIKGTSVPQKVVSDDALIHTYVNENYGEDYYGVINDLSVDGDNRCEFHVYDEDDTIVASVSIERYAQ